MRIGCDFQSCCRRYIDVGMIGCWDYPISDVYLSARMKSSLPPCLPSLCVRVSMPIFASELLYLAGRKKSMKVILIFGERCCRVNIMPLFSLPTFFSDEVCRCVFAYTDLCADFFIANSLRLPNRFYLS